VSGTWTKPPKQWS